MSDASTDRPLPPSERKRQRAWDEGRYPVAPDVAGLLVLTALLALGRPMAEATVRHVRELCRACWFAPARLAPEALVRAIAAPLHDILLIGIGLAGALAVLASLAVAAQRGIRLRLAAIGETAFAGAVGGPWEGGMALLRLLAAGLALAVTLAAARRLPGPLPLATSTARWCALLLLVLAAVDYLVRRLAFERGQGMTHAEAREDARASEGSPHTRANVRSTLRRRGQADRDRPDRILILSGHSAALVAFSPDRAVVPKLISWAQGPMASRMEEAARAQGLKVLVRPDLARLLDPTRATAVLSGSLIDALAQVHVELYGTTGRGD